MTGAACAAMEWKGPDARTNWAASANSARREPCLMFDRNHFMSAYASTAGSGVLSARSRCYTITSQGSSLAVNGVRCRLCSHQAYSRECGFDATLPHAISVAVIGALPQGRCRTIEPANTQIRKCARDATGNGERPL